MTHLTEELIRGHVDTGKDELQYVIVALHPGDSMWVAERPDWPSEIRNDTELTKLYRLAGGMGWWVGPIETEPENVATADAPILCKCGIGVHVRPEEDG